MKNSKARNILTKSYEQLHKELVDNELKVLDGLQPTFRRFNRMNEFFNFRDYFINHQDETLISNTPTALQSIFWRLQSNDPTVDMASLIQDVVYVLISGDTYIIHNTVNCYITYKCLMRLADPYNVIWVMYQYVYNKCTNGHTLVYPPTRQHPLTSGSNNPDNTKEMTE